MPIADAGPNQTVHPGNLVTLDGSGSSDPNNDELTYQWIISEKPEGSNPVINNANLENAEFSTNVNGSYVVQLTVFDGSASSTDSVHITVASHDDAVAIITKKILEALKSVDVKDWSNPNHLKAMVNQTLSLEKLAEEKYIDEAILKIASMKRKVDDHLAPVETASMQAATIPQENDWITNPDQQAKVYNSLDDMEKYLKSFK